MRPAGLEGVGLTGGGGEPQVDPAASPRTCSRPGPELWPWEVPAHESSPRAESHGPSSCRRPPWFPVLPFLGAAVSHCSGSSPFPRPLGRVFTWDCAEPAEPPPRAQMWLEGDGEPAQPPGLGTLRRRACRETRVSAGLVGSSASLEVFPPLTAPLTLRLTRSLTLRLTPSLTLSLTPSLTPSSPPVPPAPTPASPRPNGAPSLPRICPLATFRTGLQSLNFRGRELGGR